MSYYFKETPFRSSNEYSQSNERVIEHHKITYFRCLLEWPSPNYKSGISAYNNYNLYLNK
jgi:hypothetical protein